MSRFNRTLLVVNIAAIAALVLVVTVYAWNGPGAAPPTGGGALSAATNAPKDSIVINADGTVNATSTVTVGGGSGKINVGTVDPIYTIGGAKYATYLPSMAGGVKEETTGVARLACSVERIACSYEIDFGKAQKGSDLWLFWQVTDFGNDWERLVALLTPSFDGKVWYEKIPAEKKLVIFGTCNTNLTSSQDVNRGSCEDGKLEVSYRLTAARFDHEKWLNVLNAEATGIEGFVLDEK